MKRCILFFFITLCLACGNITKETINLTESDSIVTVNKGGTVTFKGPGCTLEEIAKKMRLNHISGTTYEAAVIYEISFRKGVIDSRGKIFNCTDKDITVECTFYNDQQLLGTYNVKVKARTFSRMIPAEVSFTSLKSCNRIECTE